MKHFVAVLFFALSLTTAFAQSEGILHTFTGGSDGAIPVGGMIADSAGALYGTAIITNTIEDGLVFQLNPPVDGGTWTQAILYAFTGAADGSMPESNLIFDTAGNLYGTTIKGGSNGCGTFYQLLPGSPWTESTLYNFPCGPRFDGGNYTLPWNIVMTSAGVFYGIVQSGGPFGGGWVYELAPSGGSWNYSVLYNFNDNVKAPGYANGCTPMSLILGPKGSLYGANHYCGQTLVNTAGLGTTWRLSPANGSKWNFTLLHSFGPPTQADPDGSGPAGLVLGRNGVIYGGTVYGGGLGDLGTIYSLTPPSVQGQPWTHTVLYSFTGGQNGDGSYPLSGVILGPSGVLYGATAGGGSTGSAQCNTFPGCGTIFELSETNGLWTETVLHSFADDGVDGNNPTPGTVLLRAGDLYGATTQGGAENDGVVYAFHP